MITQTRKERIVAALATCPLNTRDAFRQYAKYPTERNGCYLTGFITAQEQADVLEYDTYSLLLSSIEPDGALVAAFKEGML